MVTDAQVRRYREKRMKGYTMAAAAAAAGMSERTARRWRTRGLPSETKVPRTYRTRPDAFAEVWATQIEPRLVADPDGRLQALTVCEWLCEQAPGRCRPGQLRTLQRRRREWRARHGPAPEVFFEQTAVPGREAAMDVTDGGDLAVTIAGEPFAHLWFEGVLSFSGWTYVELAPSETFEALVSGLQGALWTLGAAPAVVRHDNLTAATHELRRRGGVSGMPAFARFSSTTGWRRRGFRWASRPKPAWSSNGTIARRPPSIRRCGGAAIAISPTKRVT